MKTYFSSEKVSILAYSELTADKVYTSKMLVQNITNHSANKKMRKRNSNSDKKKDLVA